MEMTMGSDPLRVMYVVRSYPVISQTFVMREIQELRRQGVDVDIVGVFPTPATQVLNDEAAAEAKLAEHVLPLMNWRFVAPALSCFARAPMAFLKTMRYALRERAGDPKSVVVRMFYCVAAMRVWRLARKNNAQHLHAHFLDVASDLVLLACYYERERTGKGWTWSTTVHGPWDFVQGREIRIHRKIEQSTFINCISAFGRSQLLMMTPFEQWAKVKVVHCGVDFAALAAIKAEPVPGRVVCTGRLVPEKGQTLLVHSIRALVDRGLDAELVLIGDGPGRERLEKLVADLGLSDRITFTGSLPPAEVFAHVKTATVFCLPSFAEGIPVALMEAMAIGVPVISTQVFGIPELVIHNKTGLILIPGDQAPLDDALEQLLTDAELRAQVGRGARQHVEGEFNLASNTATLAGLFREASQTGSVA
jgi:colanic acid/amylovoran biosynthesis glycosyltransferase